MKKSMSLNVRLDPELYRLVEQRALAAERTIAQEVRYALKRHVADVPTAPHLPLLRPLDRGTWDWPDGTILSTPDGAS